ncbi:hypothetical protein ACFL2B_00600 [Patescibacteria group bacterium]
MSKNIVTIRGGKIIEYREEIMWDGKYRTTITITRQNKQFIFHSSDRLVIGTLQHVTRRLHPIVRDPIINIFRLQNISERNLKAIISDLEIELY